MARSLFGLVVVAALAALQVKAGPRSNATCVDQKWSFNSLQQSPCLVSAYLSAQCTSDNDWLVPEIGTEGPYSPPSGQYANTCRCNSVQWNLLSACSLCQGGPSGSWSEWVGNCSSSVVNIGRYPQPIPSGIAIPHWAYYDFTGANIFNAGIASQQTGPGSSPAAVASSTPAYSSVAGTQAVGGPSATPLPSGPKSSSSGNNTGAIVGGVVGGVLGVAVLVLIAVVLVRKSKQSPAKDELQNQNNYKHPALVPTQPGSASPMMGQYQPGMPHPGLTSPGPDHKPYDPSDPATFPTHQQYTPSQYPQSLNYSQHPSQYQPGQYHGAPEV